MQRLRKISSTLTATFSPSSLMNDWEIAGNKNPWVCPSDRHLALRAQLKAGWSVHTQKGTSVASSATTSSSPTAKAQDKISEAERAQIAAVLARADHTKNQEGERIGNGSSGAFRTCPNMYRLRSSSVHCDDFVEHERVVRRRSAPRRTNSTAASSYFDRDRKLMERLENMRRRATGNGVTQCMLCGADFGLLGSRSYGAMCHDCRKYVCQKNCGVETYDQDRREPIFLCKICSEYREMWKKSGAWFYNRLPEPLLPATPPERSWGRAPPDRSPLRGRASGRERFSSDEDQDHAPPGRSSHQRRHNSGRNNQDERYADPRTRSGSYRRLLPQVPKEETRKSPIMQPRWALEHHRSMSYGTEPGDSSTSDEDTFIRRKPMQLPTTPDSKSKSTMQRIAVGRRHKLTDTDSEAGPDDNGSPTPPSSPRYSLPTPSSHGEPEMIAQTQTLTGDVSDSKSVDSGVVQSDNSQSLIRPITLKSVTASPSQSHAVDSVASEDQTQTAVSASTATQQQTTTLSSSFSRQLYMGQSQESSEPETSSAVRKSSFRTMESVTDIPSSPEDDLKHGRSEPSLRPPASSRASSGSRRSDDLLGSLGTLELSLNYAPDDQTLSVNVERAKNLRAMDSNGFSDPFVKLNLIPGSTKSTKLRTKTVHKSLNPEWNEVLTYYGITDEDRLKKTLRVTVLDEDRFGSDFLGETRIPLRKLTAQKERKFNVYLEKQMPVETLSRGSDASAVLERGKILLALSYNTQNNTLCIGVVRCAELLGCDPSGYSDPYVRVSLTPLTSKKHKAKTHVKKRNCNPEYNQEFAFPIALKELPNKTLEVHVYDKDIGKDDYIGGIQLGANAKGERMRHWTKVLQSPGQKFLSWHKLLPDQPSSAK